MRHHRLVALVHTQAVAVALRADLHIDEEALAKALARPAEGQPGMVAVGMLVLGESGIPVDAGEDGGHAGIEARIDGQGQGQQVLGQGAQRLLHVLLVAALIGGKEFLVVIEGQLDEEFVGILIEALEGLAHGGFTPYSDS